MRGSGRQGGGDEDKQSNRNEAIQNLITSLESFVKTSACSGSPAQEGVVARTGLLAN